MILPPLAIFVLFCLHYDKCRARSCCSADAVICGSFRLLRKRTLTPQKQKKPTRLFLFLMRCSPGFCPISFSPQLRSPERTHMHRRTAVDVLFFILVELSCKKQFTPQNQKPLCNSRNHGQELNSFFYLHNHKYIDCV